MKQIIEVDSDDTVQDGIVDKLGRIMGFGRYKGCRVTVIIKGSPCSEQEKGVHPITQSTPAPSTHEGEEK